MPPAVALEIHDLDERNVLAFDLADVLDALSPASAALDGEFIGGSPKMPRHPSDRPHRWS